MKPIRNMDDIAAKALTDDEPKDKACVDVCIETNNVDPKVLNKLEKFLSNQGLSYQIRAVEDRMSQKGKSSPTTESNSEDE